MKQNKSLTLQDFEKGLVLAGYLTPKNEDELAELESYEAGLKARKTTNESTSKTTKKNRSKKSVDFFKRTVLAGKIASELHQEPTFGHVKFQKLMYLCEQVIEMNLVERYVKQAAGPFDRKFMHSVDKELARQKWFSVQKVEHGAYSKYEYSPMINLSKCFEYYDKYYEPHKEQVNWVMRKFGRVDTLKVELVATLYYSWKELLEENKPITDQALTEKLFSWHSEKKVKFTSDSALKAINWMREKGFNPEYKR